MFRRAVSTIEGVKADSLFSYQPPINLFALCIMYPAGYILTPRWFHKVSPTPSLDWWEELIRDIAVECIHDSVSC